MRSDQVDMPGGVSSQRDVVELPGAVGIVALDENDRVLLVRQYRHLVRRRLWEIPAGLLDSPHGRQPMPRSVSSLRRAMCGLRSGSRSWTR